MILALIGLLGKIILGLLLAIIVVYAIREFRVWNNLQFFVKQGIKTVYYPIIGHGYLYIPEKGVGDQMQKFKDFIEENKDEPLVMFNTQKTSMSTGVIISDELQREFFLKDVDISVKVESVKNSHLGFFFQNGDKVQRSRSIYAKFFNYDNIKVIERESYKLIEAGMDEFIKKNSVNSTDFIKVELKDDLLTPIFTDLVDLILFGHKETFTIDGEPLCLKICEFINETYKLAMSPLNCLTADVLMDFELRPQMKKNTDLYKKIEEGCITMVNNRKKKGPSKIINLLDLLIESEAEFKAKGIDLPQEEIAEHFILLQVAGVDTSRNTSSGSIVVLGDYPEYQKKFYDTIKEMESAAAPEFPQSELREHEEFNNYVHEMIRLNSPIIMTSPRQFIKNCTVGKYKFRKGDRIMALLALQHTVSKYFENPEVFDPERLTSEKRASMKKCRYQPFSTGRRNCIGRSMGEWVVRNILYSFFKRFEIKPVEGGAASLRKTFEGTFGYEKPVVYLRLRKN